MAKPAAVPIDRKASLLHGLPPETRRVQVIEPNGKTCWKSPRKVGSNDKIVLNSNGKPVVMLGQPGRKAAKKVDREPVSEDAAEQIAAKNALMRKDPLLKTIKKDSESDTVLQMVIQSLAEEAASLRFERQEAERRGTETSALSLRRSKILKSIAETWLRKKEKIESGAIDLDSKAFSAVFSLLMETLRTVMDESGVRREQVETVFAGLSKRLSEDWKEEARARMRERERK
jgi:hypothetical protein